jgi:hypothetical protein
MFYNPKTAIVDIYIGQHYPDRNSFPDDQFSIDQGCMCYPGEEFEDRIMKELEGVVAEYSTSSP